MTLTINISRFIGRPAKACRKCKSELFFVNQFGGIECAKCQDAGECPSLFVVAGKWSDEPDEFAPDTEQESTTPVIQVALRETWVDEIDRRLNRTSHKSCGEKKINWQDVDEELASLIDWYESNRSLLPSEPFEFHKPARAARNLKDMNHQLSAKVVNPVAFYESLDVEIYVQGPRGPRVRTGTLKADLNRLKLISKAT